MAADNISYSQKQQDDDEDSAFLYRIVDKAIMPSSNNPDSPYLQKADSINSSYLHSQKIVTNQIQLSGQDQRIEQLQKELEYLQKMNQLEQQKRQAEQQKLQQQEQLQQQYQQLQLQQQQQQQKQLHQQKKQQQQQQQQQQKKQQQQQQQQQQHQQQQQQPKPRQQTQQLPQNQFSPVINEKQMLSPSNNFSSKAIASLANMSSIFLDRSETIKRLQSSGTKSSKELISVLNNDKPPSTTSQNSFDISNLNQILVSPLLRQEQVVGWESLLAKCKTHSRYGKEYSFNVDSNWVEPKNTDK